MLRVVMGNFETHHRLIGIPDRCQMCLEFQWKSFVQALADQLGIGLPKDGLSRAIAQGNLILHVRG